MRRDALHLPGAAAPLLFALVTCASEPPATTLPAFARELASPAKDGVVMNGAGDCADLGGGLRACWDAEGRPAELVRAPFPVPSTSGRGFVCHGRGRERRCVDRASLSPPFRCEGTRCTQRHPRLPDEGEWECADIAGAVVCRGGEPPAGTPPGGRGRGFACGERRGPLATAKERVCVDLSPDLPEGAAPGVRCHFEGTGSLVRVCELGTERPSLGAACSRQRPCVDGARCVPLAGAASEEGRCAPGKPEPSCWLPRDCDAGSCRFGTCTTEGSP
jgi:hypothetical protein